MTQTSATLREVCLSGPVQRIDGAACEVFAGEPTTTGTGMKTAFSGNNHRGIIPLRHALGKRECTLRGNFCLNLAVTCTSVQVLVLPRTLGFVLSKIVPPVQ